MRLVFTPNGWQGDFPYRPGRLLGPGEPAIFQADREQEDEQPADRARAQEYASRWPVNTLTTKVPHTDPTGMQTPSTPETRPR